MTEAIRTENLGKTYGRHWALRDCTVSVPPGSVAALVGPNGAGKTTLLHMLVGLSKPTRGLVEVLGRSPVDDPKDVLPRIGFVAQDHPLYRRFSVSDMLTVGARLNPSWDGDLAHERLSRLGISPRQRVGTLSGGQQAQVALVLALAKRPDVMVLDEPMASLDPVARRDFLSGLMEAVAENGTTVLLSSHIVADLQRVCDYLIVLSAGEVVLSGPIDEIVEHHRLLVGARRDTAAVAAVHNLIEESHTERQTTLLVRTNGHIWDQSWEVREVTLEDLILAYLGHPRRAARTTENRELAEARR